MTIAEGYVSELKPPQVSAKGATFTLAWGSAPGDRKCKKESWGDAPRLI